MEELERTITDITEIDFTNIFLVKPMRKTRKERI